MGSTGRRMGRVDSSLSYASSAMDLQNVVPFVELLSVSGDAERFAKAVVPDRPSSVGRLRTDRGSER